MNKVTQAIAARIGSNQTHLIDRYGFLEVMQAIDAVSEAVGQVDQIKFDDVSAWVNRVKIILNMIPPIKPETDLEDAIVHMFSR